MTSPRAPKQRIYEAVARLEITEEGAEAQLSAQSPKPDADLVLFGKGDGIVRVGESEVLTMDSLGNLDELAAVLAGITIEGADPAAVLALQAQARSILDAFGGKPDSTVADLLNYIANIDDNIGSINNTSTAALTSITKFLTAVAGNPDPSAITVQGGGLVGLAITAWNNLVLTPLVWEPFFQQTLDALVSPGVDEWGQVEPGTVADFVALIQSFGTGGGGLDEARGRERHCDHP